MRFYVADNAYYPESPDIVYLQNSKWNDWFEFETEYNVFYLGKCIGSIKIGRREQKERRAPLEFRFESLPEDYFSLGTSIDYYTNLKQYNRRADILAALNDVAYDLDLFEQIKDQRVTTFSLLRDVSESTVKGQFHRVAHGGTELTAYDFKYYLPDVDQETGEQQHLDFQVDPENNTPSNNIHVLIGNNGVGKTTIMKGMLYAIFGKEKYGRMETGWGETFANIVHITFSAFDKPLENDIQSQIPYTYVGLISANKDQSGRTRYSARNDSDLEKLFFESYYRIIKSNVKKELWHKSITFLESDSTFGDINIRGWEDVDWEELTQIHKEYTSDLYKAKAGTIIEADKAYYQEVMGAHFSPLSSGHKNILLTLVSLVDYVEEKSLVLLDEPEEHLHPPLVAAFIRALSELLTYRNGVAVIATHSPVIVQEVPKKCVWKIRKYGEYRKFDRPVIETYGENLGEITTEIFGYDVQKSGFHAVLKKVSEDSDTYESALSRFRGELGNEAKSILRAYMYDKEDLR